MSYNVMKLPKFIQEQMDELRKVEKELEELCLKVYKEPVRLEGYQDEILLSCAMDEYIKGRIERVNKLREIQASEQQEIK
mgnify:CR=1 FL=1